MQLFLFRCSFMKQVISLRRILQGCVFDRVRSCHMAVKSSFVNRHMAPRKDRVHRRAWRSLATLLLLLYCDYGFRFRVMTKLSVFKWHYYVLNLLPILPLDGGQAICALLETDGSVYRTRAIFLTAFILFFPLLFFCYHLVYLKQCLIFFLHYFS